mmetsp:Transcript_34359/g.77378  ORF Transcript_34359/g.77378 Transcript_34359/m.77378 type:complete len:274 (+) Transcript_34359:236-1057(+)
MILHGQGLLSNNCLHRQNILTHGIGGIKLVGDRAVVVTRHALTNGRLHETRQRWQHINRRENSLGVQLTIEVNLALGNVTSQVGNWVRDIIVGHRQDRKLSDGPVSSDHSPGPFVDGGQVRIHVSWITAASWNLLSCSRDLTQGICVRGHVGQNNQHVQISFVRQVLRGGQCQTRSNDTLDGGVVCQVEEQSSPLHGSTLLEIATEETGRFHVNSHGTEDNCEVVLVRVGGVLKLNKGRLAGNLCGDLIVRQSSRREDRDLLSPRHRVHDIYG